MDGTSSTLCGGALTAPFAWVSQCFEQVILAESGKEVAGQIVLGLWKTSQSSPSVNATRGCQQLRSANPLTQKVFEWSCASWQSTCCLVLEKVHRCEDMSACSRVVCGEHVKITAASE